MELGDEWEPHMQRSEVVGPPSPEADALATESVTPADDSEEDTLLRGWRGAAYETFDWFAGTREA